MAVQVGVRYASEAEVRRCADCGLVFLLPRPTVSELAGYYAEPYRAEYNELPVPERYQVDLDEARVRVRRLLPLLGPDACLIEIGSGSGAFLDSVRPYVGEVTGVEPDAASRNWIAGRLGLPVVDQIADLSRLGKTCNLMVLFHVLEHVPYPVEFLRSLGQFLQKGGRMVVELPNVDDALVTVYAVAAYQSFYYQKAHLCYFSKDTLARALKLADFSGAIEYIQRYDLSNHFRWMLTGRPGGQGYYSHILSPSLCAAYAEALIDSGHADTLWAVVQAIGNNETERPGAQPKDPHSSTGPVS
jgi:SAM-dependent methyltransferase